MNALPTGLYQPGASVLHRLDALTKILCLILMLVAVVNTTTIPGYAVLALLTALLIKISGVRPGTVLHSATRLSWFFAVILLMNLCFYNPEHPWVSWWIFRPSTEGLLQGVNVVARVFLLLVLSNLLTICTAPLAMTEAMERMLSPLRFVGVPTDLVAMILSVAIQFIPTLFEETDNIRKAQTARGARFDSPKLLEKGKAVLPLVVPIFLAAFKRADELSLAMEARGYRTDVRRSRKKYTLQFVSYNYERFCPFSEKAVIMKKTREEGSAWARARSPKCCGSMVCRCWCCFCWWVFSSIAVGAYRQSFPSSSRRTA